MMLKNQPPKVRNYFVAYLADVMYLAANNAFEKHVGKQYTSNLEEDARVKDCASEFYELAEETFLLDKSAGDLEKHSRLGDFAEVLTEFRECTRLIPTYENNCQRFVSLGWIPPAKEAMKIAVTKKAVDIIGRAGSSFETLFVDDVNVPEDLYDQEEDEDEGEEEEDEEEEGEEVEADSAEEGDEEEAVPDSAEEGDEEEDGAESDGTTESQYWKAEAEEARERMKADEEGDEEEDEPPPAKKKKKKA